MCGRTARDNHSWEGKNGPARDLLLSTSVKSVHVLLVHNVRTCTGYSRSIIANYGFRQRKKNGKMTMVVIEEQRGGAVKAVTAVTSASSRRARPPASPSSSSRVPTHRCAPAIIIFKIWHQYRKQEQEQARTASDHTGGGGSGGSVKLRR